MKKILLTLLFLGFTLNLQITAAQSTCTTEQDRYNTCAGLNAESLGACASLATELESCKNKASVCGTQRQNFNVCVSANKNNNPQSTCATLNTELTNCEQNQSNSIGTTGGSTSGNSQSGTGNNNAPSAEFKYNGPTFDGPGLRGGAGIVAGQLDNNISKERDLKRLIIGWTNFITSVVALLAVVALVWAGTLYITAFGDDSRMESAKKIVIWVVIGIILILGAYAIVNTVMQAVFA